MRSIVATLFALHATCALASDTWVALTPANAQFGSSVLATDPFAPDTLYADAFYINAMAKSTDGGKTWSVLTSFHGFVRKIIVERSAPNRVTAMTWDDPDVGIHRSTDGGMTWSSRHVSLPVSGLAEDIAVDPLNTNVIYTAHPHICLTSSLCVKDSGGISKSTDGGRHWTALFKGIDVEQILIDPFGSGTIYAGSWSEWRRSQNGGMSWTSLGDETILMAPDPVVPGVLYGSGSFGLLRSDDRGDTWTYVGSPFGVFFPRTIAVDPTDRKHDRRRRRHCFGYPTKPGWRT